MSFKAEVQPVGDSKVRQNMLNKLFFNLLQMGYGLVSFPHLLVSCSVSFSFFTPSGVLGICSNPPNIFNHPCKERWLSFWLLIYSWKKRLRVVVGVSVHWRFPIFFQSDERFWGDRLHALCRPPHCHRYQEKLAWGYHAGPAKPFGTQTVSIKHWFFMRFC